MRCCRGFWDRAAFRTRARGRSFLRDLRHLPNIISYPSARALRIRLEELYGARLLYGIGKTGDRQIIRFGLDMVREDAVGAESGLFFDAVAMLAEVMLRPVTKDDRFLDEFFLREKESLSRDIRALKNDKTRYSLLRCTECMFAQETIGLNPMGTVEAVEKADPDVMYGHFCEMRESAPVDVFVVGNVDTDQVVSALEEHAVFPKTSRKDITSVPAALLDVQPKQVFETEPVNQGKISMGFRTGITLDHPLCCAIQVFDEIFGGYSQSKLFMNVREKHAMAYYAQSLLDTGKGLLYAVAGVDPRKRDEAIELMLAQFDACKNGDFSLADVDLAKRSIIHRLRAAQDSIDSKIGTLYEQSLAGIEADLKARIESIRSVDKETILRAASQIRLDTTHFLGPEEVAD